MKAATRAMAVLAATMIAGLGAAATAQGAVQVSQSGWAWNNPTPQGNSLRDMAFSGGRGYAIGDAGTVLRTDDGGTTWTGLASGTFAGLDRLQVVTPDVVTILGNKGCVLRRSVNGGASFARIYVLAETDCPNPVASAYFVTPDLGYLLLQDGSVLRTTDGGETFSKQTAVPGTVAAGGGGAAAAGDLWFTGADTGVVQSRGTVFSTTDAGVSWKAVDTATTPDARFLAAGDHTAYLYGRAGVLRSQDDGATWAARTPGSFAGMSCATVDVCLLVTGGSNGIVRTDDGGATTSEVTVSSRTIFTAGFASATRVVAAGLGGTTVVSDDGGLNFAPVGGDLGILSSGLRAGADAQTAFALGRKGALARTSDGGNQWKALAVPTSADVRDVAFSSATVGYALDASGGLFKTANGGSSWQTLDPGTAVSPLAVATVGDGVVLLVGPKGVLRQAGAGRFDPVADKDVRTKALRGVDVNGASVLVWGAKTLAVSTSDGASFANVPLPDPRPKPKAKKGKKAKKLPANPLTLAGADFVDAKTGYVSDVQGRLFTTRNGGKTWTQLTAVGAGAGGRLAFGDRLNGFLASSYSEDATGAYVLRTSDGGLTWRPQRVAVGGVTGIISPGAGQAYTLVGAPGADGTSLFSTTTGGDAGTESKLSLSPAKGTVTKKALKKAQGRVTVRGTLDGAQGGERIVVSASVAGTGRWAHQVVLAGANGGSFTATFKIAGTSRFVAQWAGDSGRRGAGTKAVTVTVK